MTFVLRNARRMNVLSERRGQRG